MQKRHLTGLMALILSVFLLAACGGEDPTPTQLPGGMMNMAPPADLDTATSRPTDNGLFQVTINSELEPLALNQIHSWTAHVESPEGEPVEEAAVTVDGGMPQHRHGFPTAPEVTEELGGGDYLIEGVKFSMPGWWELKLTVEAGGQSDSVTFNIVLP